MGTKKAKALTFRQRLRVDAIGDLGTLVDEVTAAAKKIVLNKNIEAADLMALASNPKAKSLCHGLVTKLANGKERELEAIYNKQQDLDLSKVDSKAGRNETQD